jgi:hypothetical protein
MWKWQAYGYSWCLPLLLCPIAERTSVGSPAKRKRLAGAKKFFSVAAPPPDVSITGSRLDRR